MTLFPAPFEERFKAAIKDLRARVAKLETRTAGIDSGFPLMVLPGVISGTYTSGNPQVYVNGATALSGPYAYLSSYAPAANDPVLLVPVGALGSYVVIGKY